MKRNARHGITAALIAAGLVATATGAGAATAATRPAPRPVAQPTPPAARPLPVYSVDGSGNNTAHPLWGSAGIALIRKAAAAYGDLVSTPAGESRPSARAISNAVSTQKESIPNSRNLSDFIYVWGQFLDHDINLTTSGTESLPIAVPAGDESFDPTSTGSKVIPFTRSAVAAGTGTSTDNPRQQIAGVTAFIDGSQVYGSDTTRANALRTFNDGLLKTSAGNMMPFNTDNLPNANDSHMLPNSELFLAGDVRANENPDLVALQTLFVREHNRIAADVKADHPTFTDEQIYQNARSIVIAELQAITFNEYLPALLGRQAITNYTGYRANVNPSITNEFATAAFRFGHSVLDGEIGRLNNDGTSIAAGPLTLRESFFNTSVFDPTAANHEGDIDPFLKAAASGTAQEVDLKVIDDVRNFLFGAPGQGGFDLAALNIQRGRDNGLADYNTTRAAYGLPRVTSFAQITPDVTVQNQLRDLYGSVDNIDLWVGGLAERHARGASVGPLFQRIITDQFNRLRAGDHNWYEGIFTGPQLRNLQRTHLSDIIRRNTSLTTVQPNVFRSTGTTAS